MSSLWCVKKKSSAGELSQLSQIAYFKQLILNLKISETVNDQNSNLLLMIDNWFRMCLTGFISSTVTFGFNGSNKSSCLTVFWVFGTIF